MTEAESFPFDTVGARYGDFEVMRVIPIDELQCQLRELVHLPTNALVMHIANDDPENLFCLSFQTLPDNSNGVAHILEHTVLCGSTKYPVKDPFFAMSRRSLNTFMNALTGSDFTCYPASSQVPKDFYNLLEVYLDAVFHPILNELSFLQEGHRLEFSDPADPSSPLEFKGIVFNEMKGALSSPSSRLFEVLNHALYPNIIYGVNSGGDPKVIPTLTYEELKAFHRKYYHPSRCLFFFYGNLPLHSHLDFIATHTLNAVQKEAPLGALPRQPRFAEPRRIIDHYPISADEETSDKALIAFGWLTCHILEQETLLALYVLEIILLDTDASPLKHALLKSGLCKQVGAYMESDNTEIPFVITLRGCNPENADSLEELIRTTLKRVIEEGIAQDAIENALHQLEFHRSEITGDHSPFGLSLFMRSALLRQHGANPEEGLRIHSLFHTLEKNYEKDPQYFNRLIEKYLLNNPHFVRVIMKPDNELSTQEITEEREKLDEIKGRLSPAQIREIVERAAELAAFQENQEEVDPDILPKVTLEDVPKKARVYPLAEEFVGPLHVFHHDCFTNGILYADLVFDLPDIAEEDLSYVRLFATLLTQVGCGERTYMENLDYIQANLGAIGASLTFNLQASDHEKFRPSFYIRGKALHRKTPELFKLLYELSASPRFNDIARLKELIMKQYSGLQGSINQSAMRYAINLSASSLDIPSKIADDWYGLSYYRMIKELAENFDQRADALVRKLEDLSRQLLCLDKPHLIITCDAEMYSKCREEKFYDLSALITKPFAKWKGQYPLLQMPAQGRIISAPIAFTGKVFKTVPFVHPAAPALNIAAFLCDNLTLHTRLREQGGAYGGGAISNPMAGNFYFYSYRDPNIASTLQAFEESIQKIGSGDFDDTDLEEAKLEMIQTMDGPVAPGSRGDIAYGWLREGKTLEVRQAFRDRLLGLTRQDVIDAVQNHIIPRYFTGTTVVFAGRELLEKENIVLKGLNLPSLEIKSIDQLE